MSSRVLTAVTQAAIDATGAARGWVVAVGDNGLEVVTALGEGAAALVGKRLPEDTGTVGFVMGSGQPVALTPGPDDPRMRAGVAALVERPPASIACVPCGTALGVHGALEIADKQGAAGFSFDDLEIVTLLAGVAGAVLADDGVAGPRVSTAAVLGRELEQLEATDPEHYARVAMVCEALLGGA